MQNMCLDQSCLVTCCKFFDKTTSSRKFSEEFYKIFKKSYSIEYVQIIVSKTFFLVSSYPSSLPRWTLPLVNYFAPRQKDFQRFPPPRLKAHQQQLYSFSMYLFDFEP